MHPNNNQRESVTRDPNVDTNFLVFVVVGLVALIVLGYILFPHRDAPSTSTPAKSGGSPSLPANSPVAPVTSAPQK
jgi:hypothetical protein